MLKCVFFAVYKSLDHFLIYVCQFLHIGHATIALNPNHNSCIIPRKDSYSLGRKACSYKYVTNMDFLLSRYLAQVQANY